MDRAITFEITHICKQTGARTGLLHTPHGTVETPMFMPVGTAATVKFVSPEELYEMGAGVVLANTYHCWLRPGEDVVAAAGGFSRQSGRPSSEGRVLLRKQGHTTERFFPA